jgi:RNA polymerase sigma-70 factor, ECF subfamily
VTLPENSPSSKSVQNAGPSDGEVIDRVRGGEVELFEVLMRRYNQRVFRVAPAVLPSDAEAEDLAQEAWVRAYEHLGEFAGRAAFSTWLIRIVLHEGRAREPVRPDGRTGARTHWGQVSQNVTFGSSKSHIQRPDPFP